MSKLLLPTHPLSIKIDKLSKFLNDNHLQIEYNGYDLVITDTENHTYAKVRDLDDGTPINSLPNWYEVKLVTD